MYNLNMQNHVQKLLDSNIQSKTISKEVGINESIISKLRNGSQQINETKHGYIDRLYNCYLNHKKEIEAQQGVDDHILSVKLPASVRKFLDELSYSVAVLQHQKTSRINKVYVYDEYDLDDSGNSKDKSSYIVIDETIPLNKSGEIYPYHISIKNKIEDRTNVESIEDLKIIFNKEELVVTLKKHKYEGAKIKTVKTSNGSLTIQIMPLRDSIEIRGIESDYFEIQYQNENGQTASHKSKKEDIKAFIKEESLEGSDK